MDYRELLELTKKHPNPFILEQSKINYQTYVNLPTIEKIDDIDDIKEDIVSLVEEVPVIQTAENKPIIKQPDKMITKIHRGL